MAPVVLTFVLTLALIVGAYWLFIVRPEEQVHEAIWRRLRSKGGGSKVRTELLKRAQQLSTVPAFETVLNRGRSGLQPLEQLLEQSGIRMTVGTVLLTCAVAGLLVTYLVLQFSGSLLAAVLVGAVAGYSPLSVLKIMRTRRVARFEEQFPEGLALISRALKAGHTFTTGLAMVAEEMPSPLGPEFRLLFDEQNYGRPLPDALKEFARRVPLLDARFFVTAVLIQRESGGNLAEILDNIASVIRDRFRVKRQIRVISAHARMTGWVLVGVPPSLAAVLFTINPDHWKTMTGSPLGIQMIVGAIVLQLLGTLTIRQLIRIEY